MSDLAPPALVPVSFSLPAEVHADSASVVGDFNDWDPERGVMQRDGDGSFSCTLSIASGRRYQYRFLLDGDRWTNDWSAHDYAPNSFGGEDSVLDLTHAGQDGGRDGVGEVADMTELDEQRERHQSVVGAGSTERPDDGLAPLINNTGDDGGAASG